MWKTYAILSSLFIAIGLSAQDEGIAQTKWHIDAIGLRGGSFSQKNANLDYRQIRDMASSPKGLSYAMEDYVQTYKDPNIGETLGAFVRWRKQRTDFRSREIEVLVDFYTFSEQYTEYSAIEDSREYIGWCLLNNRVDLDVKYWFDYHGYVGGFRLGPSIGAGASYNDEVIILQVHSPDIVVDGMSNYFGSAHINVQGYIRVASRLEIALGGRAGMGAQFREFDYFSSFAANLSLGYLL